ncbi:SpoIID/LytB domain protein [Anoxybacillus kamchatkensis]|nr:SpoIID/LytB domain-containing protein [Anoxybacillus ayderensis]MBA2877220.1 SpoIID/LytB domain protein [Anoxybacillus ayderensis]
MLVFLFVICIYFIPLSMQKVLADAGTISVKLINYIGNKNTIKFTTVGSYKLDNGNTRLDGKDRFSVANNIATSGWGKAETVFIVNYTAFADALAATPLAYKYDAPILLTHTDKLTNETRTMIQRLRPKKIVVIGGEGSVSSIVENELKSLALTVDRIGGKDRYEVAKHISNQLGESNTAILAHSGAFADALSIAPYAAKNGYPILLTRRDILPRETRETIADKNTIIIVGGEGSVSAKVASMLIDKNVIRIGGKDRYEVAANILRMLNPSSGSAFLASGTSLADALTGSVLAAKQNSPLLLTRPTQLPDSIRAVILEQNIYTFTVLGGVASVSETIVSNLPNELQMKPYVEYIVKVENGRLSLYEQGVKIKDFGTSSFVLVPRKYSGENQIHLNGIANYIGKMEFVIENGMYVRPINRDIPFEDYLKGVVPREMPASWPLEALKAQAVAARTYSVRDVGKVVVDTQAYQVYGGYNWSERSSKAVEETKGQVLRYNGNLISAVFSSSNGGYTEANNEAWGGKPVPYLPAKLDPYDPKNPWDLTLRKKQIDISSLDLKNPAAWWENEKEVDSEIVNNIKKWMNQNGWSNKEIKIVSIDNISPMPEKTAGQRYKNMNITFTYFVRDLSSGFVCEQGPCNGENNIKLFTFNNNLPMSVARTMIGANKLKSSMLQLIEQSSDAIVIKGNGYGHGVGMSQWGAKIMAERYKKSYSDILRFYYPGTTLGK